MEIEFSTENVLNALKKAGDYTGKTIVVKYGGNAMVNETLKRQVMQDIAALHAAGIRIVLVHGGGPDINQLMDRLGKKPEFVNGLRVTDTETVEIVEMVLTGKVNKTLVNLLNAEGAKAVGISGIDAATLVAVQKDPALGFVGKVTKVNTELVEDLLDMDYIPVVSTVACDYEANAYNINGDTAAAYLAGALKAERLIMMTDISGVLRDFHDPSTLIKHLTPAEANQLKQTGIVSGGMIPKVDCCITALNAGVKYVKITDGRVPHCLLNELLFDSIGGTEFSMD